MTRRFGRPIGSGLFMAMIWLLGMSGSGFSYILEGPHILHLSVAALREPAGLEVVQKRYMLGSDSAGSLSGEFDETLWYSYPGRLRGEIVSEYPESLFLFDGDRFLRIHHGRIVSEKESPTDHYLDVLRFRDRTGLQERLQEAGVDAHASSLQRYKERICYVIGRQGDDPEFPSSLWVDKETFVPVRYLVKKDGWHLEIIYSDWMESDRVFYPREIRIFLDNKPFSLIKVEAVSPKNEFSESFFDSRKLAAGFPNAQETDVSGDTQGIGEIQKKIQDFKRLYE